MTFERQPTLPGALIRLRPLRPEDEEALYAVASDPLIWQQHPASTRYLKHEFGRYFAEAIESQGALLVLETGSAEPVGTSRYGRYCEGEKEIEIGWTFLARRCWGGSYNGELKRLMLNHAFGVVDKVLFRIGANNVRSQKAIEKIGGVRDVAPDAKGNVLYRIARERYRKCEPDR